MKANKCKTAEKNAKSLGALESGVSHWKWQRISAITLVPLLCWFIYMIMNFLVDPEYVVNTLLEYPVSLFFFIILINLSIYHGLLGFKVICEDYIHNKCAMKLTMILCYSISFITMCSVTFALIMNYTINI